jgi:hypothetical protein
MDTKRLILLTIFLALLPLAFMLRGERCAQGLDPSAHSLASQAQWHPGTRPRPPDIGTEPRSPAPEVPGPNPQALSPDLDERNRKLRGVRGIQSSP